MLLDNDLQSELKPELEPHERVLWINRPKQGLIFRVSDIVLIPFSIFWFGFACFWEFLAIIGEGTWFFILFGIPFVLVGFQICIGRFYSDIKKRKQTIYAVTDQRILIFMSYPKKKLRFLYFKDITEMQIKKAKGDYMNLLFGTKYYPLNFATNINWPGGRPASIFEFVTDAEKAIKIVEEQQKNQSSLE